jgi:hypothetical protein
LGFFVFGAGFTNRAIFFQNQLVRRIDPIAFSNIVEPVALGANQPNIQPVSLFSHMGILPD